MKKIVVVSKVLGVFLLINGVFNIWGLIFSPELRYGMSGSEFIFVGFTIILRLLLGWVLFHIFPNKYTQATTSMASKDLVTNTSIQNKKLGWRVIGIGLICLVIWWFLIFSYSMISIFSSGPHDNMEFSMIGLSAIIIPTITTLIFVAWGISLVSRKS